MKTPTITEKELSEVTLARENNEDGKQTRWQIRENDENDLIAILPAWLNETQALEIATLVMAHEKRGIERGEDRGRREERNRITYGFRIVLEPLIDAINEHANTTAPVERR